MQGEKPMGGEESQVPVEETANKSGNKSMIKKVKEKAKSKVKKLSSKLKKPKGHGDEDKQQVVDESVGYEDEEEDAEEEDEPEESVPQSSPKDLEVPLDEYALLKKKESEEKDGEKLGENLPAQTIAEQAPEVFRGDGPPDVLQAVPTEYHYRDETEEPKPEERDSLSERELPSASNDQPIEAETEKPKEEELEKSGDVESKPAGVEEPAPANEEVPDKPEEKSTGSKLEEEATANALERTDVKEIPDEGREEKFQQQSSEPDKEPEESKEPEKDVPEEESFYSDAQPVMEDRGMEAAPEVKQPAVESSAEKPVSKPEESYAEEKEHQEPSTIPQKVKDGAVSALGYGGIKTEPEEKSEAVSKPEETSRSVETEEQPSTTQKLKDTVAGTFGYGGVKTEPDETSEAVEETSGPTGQQQPSTGGMMAEPDEVASEAAEESVEAQPRTTEEPKDTVAGAPGYDGESQETSEAVSKPVESAEAEQQQSQPTLTQKLKDTVVGTLDVGAAQTEPDETSEAPLKPKKTPEPLEGKDQPKTEPDETSEAVLKPDEPLEGEEEQQQPSTTRKLMDSVAGTFGYGGKKEPDEPVKTEADETWETVSKPEETSEPVEGGEQQQTSSLKDAILNKLGYGAGKSYESAEPKDKPEEKIGAVETAAGEQQPGAAQKVVGTATQLKDTLVDKLGYAGAPNTEESKETSAEMNYRFSNLLGAPYRGGNVAFVGPALLVSPVGNRVSLTDLVKSESATLASENASDVSRIAVSPDGALMLSIDSNGGCILVNLRRRIDLHRLSFKAAVTAIKFNPQGTLFAVGIGRLLQVWRTPGFRKEFTPFQLVRKFPACPDTVTCVDWSSDGSSVMVGCKDFTVRIFSLHERSRPVLLSAHRNAVKGVFFASWKEEKGAYTLSKDAALCHWRFVPSDASVQPASKSAKRKARKRRIVAAYRHSEEDVEEEEQEDDVVEIAGTSRKRKSYAGARDGDEQQKGRWELVKKHLFMQSARLSACDYHKELNLIVAGFSSGVFGIYQMPDFSCIHLLSISKEKITSSVFNQSGNWIAFGCAKLGQLLVWEWRSETYVLKQQGHYFDVNCVAYSGDSQLIATGADDNKVKVWNASSGFCFVTFAEHTNAVTAILFLPGNHAVLSASIDGTVRAWDLMRYRNFRTFTTPSPTQFVSLAADQSGEIICAGSLDNFQIYVWSMKTGRLLDVLSGHEGPVHGLAFSPTSQLLASSSWDKTVRLWDVFEGKGGVETFTHTHEVLTVAHRPDGKQLACSTIDGQIHFWDPLDGLLMGTIEGRRDIAGGRLMTDRRTATNSSYGKCFTTMAYSADGTFLLAGGKSKYICMYDVADQVLLRRFQISHNQSLDGVLDFLNSKRMTEAGPIDLINDYDSDKELGVDKQIRTDLGMGLPGAQANLARPIVRTKCLRISPTGRSWAAATTEGLLVYSMDNIGFDPYDLDVDVTPEAIEKALRDREFSRALVLSLRLNEPSLIKQCVERVPPSDIRIVVDKLSINYVRMLIDALAMYIEQSPHLEFLLKWCQELFVVHGRNIQSKNRDLMPALRSLLKAVTRLHEDLAAAASANHYLLQYLCSAPVKDAPGPVIDSLANGDAPRQVPIESS